MNKLYYFLVFFFGIQSLQGQEKGDFENYSLPMDTFVNDAGNDNVFITGLAILHNSFEDFGSYQVWSGWAVSTQRDTITPGFTNEGSSYVGSGVEGSDHYGVVYAPSVVWMHFDSDTPVKLEGMYVTNNTYAGLSMKDGDSFAKKFGGINGTDKDFFALTVVGYLNGEAKNDTVTFYLADFRSDDSSEDFIVNEWTWMDTRKLGAVDSVSFSLSSSDNGIFGMNTPAYFCVDNILVDKASSIIDAAHDDGYVYPNPAHDYIKYKGSSIPLQIIDQHTGRSISIEKNSQIDISNLRQGQYILRTLDGYNYLFAKQ